MRRMYNLTYRKDLPQIYRGFIQREELRKNSEYNLMGKGKQMSI